MKFQDMREYLAFLEKDGLLERLNLPLEVQRGNRDLQALMRYLHSEHNQALILEGLKNFNTPDVPLVFNPFGSRERTGLTIGHRDPVEAKAKHTKILGDPGLWREPVVGSSADVPCKENIITGDDVSMDKQVPHVWFGREDPAYLTNGVAVSKDPETGERNVGWYRGVLMWDAGHPEGGTYPADIGKRHLAVYAYWNPPMNHIGVHLAKARRMGKPLEVAYACSCDPAIHLAACTGLPFGSDEYAFAGGLRGEPVELVKCETVDLEVPATAEYVIEGEMTVDEDTIVGWHSNVCGYYDPFHVLPLMKVNAVTHRNNPMWYGTIEMVPPFDHVYIGFVPVEGEILADLQRKIPEVKDVVVTPSFTYVVQLSVDGAAKPHPEFGKYVIHAVWGSSGRWGRTAKMIIVVGPDVDPYDLSSVEWAVMSRVQPYSDSIINKSGQAFVDDPSAPVGPQGIPLTSEQVGIDATIKVPERFETYREVSDADPEDVARIAGIVESARS